MPLKMLRLNHAPSSHPNDLISFIKPLPRGPGLQADQRQADRFLRAIAAQCLPIMKSHQLSVTSLEEHEANREFIGRNFNNGEVIQLVLRRGDGAWMSFRQVQMVMMHELAHNVQMNHGKGFWAERNRFAVEMKALWDRGYTGEGFWGSGRSLEGLQAHAGNMVGVGEGREVEGLCGGTFRTRGLKRKRGRGDGQGKGALTWKEKKDRRIEKKFGKDGVSLGEDEDARIKLEIGRRGPLGGKPKVAGSKRGRDLRAAAALARFEVEKKEERPKKEEEEETESESGIGDDGSDADEVGGGKAEAALDINGNRLLDSMGFGMIKVCGDEDVDDVNIKQEMEDFATLETQLLPMQRDPQYSSKESEALSDATESPAQKIKVPRTNGSDTTRNDCGTRAPRSIRSHRASTSAISQPPRRTETTKAKPSHPPPPPTSTLLTSSSCPICSTPALTSSLNITCPTCSHVLNKRKDPHAWHCSAEACKGSEYVNAGDCGRCGACGASRSTGMGKNVITG